MSDRYGPYSSYSTDELLTDQRFRRWALDPTPEEDAFWSGLLEHYPRQSMPIAEARHLIQALNDRYTVLPLPEGAREQDWQRLSARLQQAERPSAPVRRLRPRRLGLVAGMLVLLSIGAVVYFYLRSNDRLEYATGIGEQLRVILPDASEVVLNANSRLTTPRFWTEGGDRQVKLEGEAYFKVRPMPVTKAGFYVYTQDLTVEVLGTTFNVQQRRGRTRVFLEEGHVRLGTPDSMVVLQPGDVVAYSQQEQRITESGRAAAKVHTSWTRGVLIFGNTPLVEALQQLTDIYGVTFELENEALQSRTITSTGMPVDNLDLSLSLLEKALDLDVQPITPTHYQLKTQPEMNN